MSRTTAPDCETTDAALASGAVIGRVLFSAFVATTLTASMTVLVSFVNWTSILSMQAKLTDVAVTAWCAFAAIFSIVAFAVAASPERPLSGYLFSLGLIVFLPVYLLPVMVVTPLVIVTAVIAATCHRSIERLLGVWCTLMPFFLWVVACAPFAIFTSEPDRLARFPERLTELLLSGVGVLFLIGPALASVVFYTLSRRARKMQT